MRFTLSKLDFSLEVRDGVLYFSNYKGIEPFSDFTASNGIRIIHRDGGSFLALTCDVIKLWGIELDECSDVFKYGTTPEQAMFTAYDALKEFDAHLDALKNKSADTTEESSEEIVTLPWIKYSLTRDGTNVTFRIYEQDESTRGVGFIAEKNGVSLWSAGCPQLSCSTCYIRGANEYYDNIPDSVFASNEREAIEYVNNVHDLLASYNPAKKEDDTSTTKDESAAEEPSTTKDESAAEEPSTTEDKSAAEEPSTTEEKVKLDNIEYTLKRDGRTVYFQIREQNEGIRDSGRIVNGDPGVCSLASPELTKSTIYVRGREEYRDKIVSELDFDSESEAKEYISKAHAALKEFDRIVTEKYGAASKESPAGITLTPEESAMILALADRIRNTK